MVIRDEIVHGIALRCEGGDEGQKEDVMHACLARDFVFALMHVLNTRKKARESTISLTCADIYGVF